MTDSSHKATPDAAAPVVADHSKQPAMAGDPGSSVAQNRGPKPPWGTRMMRWLLFLGGSLLLLSLAYRWVGTSTVRGTVQRVYEEEHRHLADFVAASGEVYVVENEPVRFPHFKTDTADLQAQLHRFAITGDIIDLTTWGLRASWLGVFPNAISADYVRSNEMSRQKHVDRLTQLVIDELIDQGVVNRGPGSEGLRPGLTEALKKGLSAPPPPDGD